MVVSLEYWSLMTAVAAVTPVVIVVLMALEKAVTILSILLLFRVSV